MNLSRFDVKILCGSAQKLESNIYAILWKVHPLSFMYIWTFPTNGYLYTRWKILNWGWMPLCPSSPLRIVYIYILGEDGMGDGKGASLKTLMPCWKIALGEGFLLFRFRRSAIIRIICKPQNLLTFIKINLIIFLKNCRYWTENRWKNSSVNLYSSWNGRSFICTALLRIGPPEERKVMKEEKW